MKAFQAYASGNFRVTAATPRAAAEQFFARFPNKRKCSIIEGEAGEHSFTVRYGIASAGEWPRSFNDVTKRSMLGLPGEA